MRDLSIYWLWERRHWSPWDVECFGQELELIADSTSGCPAARRLAVTLAEASRAGVPRVRLVRALCDMARVVVNLDYVADASDRSFASHALVLAGAYSDGDAPDSGQLGTVLEMLNDGSAHRATAAALMFALDSATPPVQVFAYVLTIMGQLARTVPHVELNRLVVECSASVYRRIFVSPA